MATHGESLIELIILTGSMASDKKSEGFQSGAGLIRYFEEEEIKGPALDPKLVVYIGIAVAIMVELAKIFWPP
ncbi:hypothetical protein [Thermoplasma volcanium GSS1]|nr:hypothetical protein [Thermoplasma volcanium GSS1]